MGTSTLITLAVVIAIFLGVRSIVRDWRKKFAEDDEHATARRKAYLERNKAEARSDAVVTLEKDADGVYRPSGSDNRKP